MQHDQSVRRLAFHPGQGNALDEIFLGEEEDHDDRDGHHFCGLLYLAGDSATMAADGMPVAA